MKPKSLAVTAEDALTLCERMVRNLPTSGTAAAFCIRLVVSTTLISIFSTDRLCRNHLAAQINPLPSAKVNHGYVIATAV